MRPAVARGIVRAAAWLAPARLRARWREEWLAEIADEDDIGCRFAKIVKRHPMSFLAGAVWDAISSRWTTAQPRPARAGGGWAIDLLQTWRLLRKSPGHAGAVVLCLGVGLVVSITTFSVVNALLFGEIPGVRDRATLARVFIAYEGVFGSEGVGGPDMVAAGPLATSDVEMLDASRTGVFSGLAAEGALSFSVSLDGRAVGTTGAFVSADYFEVLGTTPATGRLLTPADDRLDAPEVAVVGYHLWRERFDGRSDIVGHSILVGNRSFTVVGVAPERFTGIQPADIGTGPLDYEQLWLPLHHAAAWPGAPGRDQGWHSVVGRLAPGVTKDMARMLVPVAASHIEAARPDARRHAEVVLRSHGFGPDDAPLRVLLVVGLFLSVPLGVLAIGCANVANLQLARASARTREIAVRLALGASRRRVVRLLGLEAFALTLLASVAGWLGSALALRAASTSFPLPLTMNWRVLMFAAGLGLLVMLMAGLAPAWLTTRRAMSGSLKKTAQAGGLGHTKLRNALVIAQVAVSLILLLITALAARSVQTLARAMPPMAGRLIVAKINVKPIGYTPAMTRHLIDEVLTSMRADPRVHAAAFADFGLTGEGLRYWEPPEARDVRHYAAGGHVTASWFDAAGVRVLSGSTSDRPDAAAVSASMAAALAPGGSPIGRLLRVQRSADTPVRTVQIAAVVSDPIGRLDRPPEPAIFLPMPAEPPPSLELYVRSDHQESTISALRAIVQRLDPRLPWITAGTAAATLERDIDPVRYLALSVGGLGTLALVLAAAGLYAVIGYVVSLRAREMGIRLAIGADRRDMFALVIGQALRLAAKGILLGLALGVPAAFAMRALFVGVSPIDPAAIGAPLVLLVTAATGAALVPARRAARVDPVVVLRQD